MKDISLQLSKYDSVVMEIALHDYLQKLEKLIDYSPKAPVLLVEDEQRAINVTDTLSEFDQAYYRSLRLESLEKQKSSALALQEKLSRR